MASTKEQAQAILDKCEELKRGKFIVATKRIGDILKCIVNHPELYNLFKSITTNFDYPAAKKKYLITQTEGGIIRNRLVLPDTVSERLAFIFCLLVEFDQNTMNFGNFLQTYYTSDGSYYACFQSFCNTVIADLEDSIREVFADDLNEQVNGISEPEKIDVPHSDYEETHRLLQIDRLILQEKTNITSGSLSVEDKEAALAILEDLSAAIHGDGQSLNGLILGYNFFLLYTQTVSSVFDELVNIISQVG